ncbi:MAG: VWA domain-containing protein [Clostridium sp.]|nr:VWA domain-containing protein [Clostridium sp.]
MDIEVSRAYAFILIPIILVFMYIVLKKFKNLKRKNLVNLISRILIIIFIVCGMADITLSIKGRNISTIFILDVSDSMSAFKEKGIDFIDKALEEMPKNNKAGVVVFGDNATIDKVMDNKKEYNGIKSAPLVSATNIEEAINTSFSLFDKNASKRIVLITDGEENKGDLLNNIALLNKENIDLKVYKVSNESGNEVYVENVKVPDNISIGEEFTVTTTIESNVQTKAKLTLFSGRDKKAEEEVELQKGSNKFVFKDVQTTGGFKGYRVLVEAYEDTNGINNEYSCFTNVIAPPNILVIQGKENSALGVIETLKNTSCNYNIVSPNSAPRELNEMLEYKTIVLCDVHKDDLNSGFMDNIESYVKDYGGGVVTFGGENSYALGGYRNTSLEKILPVNMDKKGKNEVPPISISLIIDKSGSMSSENGEVSKLTLAKEAAMNALESLRESDEINVIAFDDKYQNVVEMQSAKDIKSIKEMIGGISIGGGTSIYPALEQGYKSQLNSKGKIKHIVLLTDGQDGFSLSNYADLINNIKNEGITLSTVSVGEDADGNLLEALANQGGGRHYHTDQYTDIPRIFAREVLLSAGTYIINEEFTPSISSNSEILSGIDTKEGIPNLKGYIGTSIKDNATEILTSNHDEPILASYRYGIGKTVSWTSDINGEWSGDYLTWEEGAQLIKNAIYWTIPELSDEGKLSISQDGNEALIEFYSDSNFEDSKIKAVYNSESGNNGELELTQEEPGKYTGRVKLNEIGFYNFNVREEKNGEVINNYTGAFSLQYSDEYKFNKNKDKLNTLVSEVNGKFINNPKDAFKGELKEAYKKINLSNIFLIFALVLFFLDIVYRRLNLDFSKYFKKLKNSSEKNKKEKSKDEENKKEEKEYTNISDEKENDDVISKDKKKKQKKKEEKEQLDVSSLLKNKKKW